MHKPPESKAERGLPEQGPDWKCTIAKNIPEDKPCRKDARGSKDLAAPSCHPHLQKHRNKDQWGVVWNSLVRAAEGVKATGAYRSREQLGCYELAATPASIRLPTPRSLYPGISVSQGSSITLISFSLTVWLASSRYNVPARGSETRVWILLSLMAYCCWNVSTSSELAVGRGRLLRKARPERKVCGVAACGHDKHTLARWHHVILWRTECHWRLKKVDRNSEAKKIGGPGSILARSTALPLAWASYVSRIIFSSTAWQ